MKKAKKAVERDSFGFQKGSLSSAAIKMLADGKTPMKDVRKKFRTLSFTKLAADLKRRGFEMKKDEKGVCSIAKKPKA